MRSFFMPAGLNSSFSLGCFFMVETFWDKLYSAWFPLLLIICNSVIYRLAVKASVLNCFWDMFRQYMFWSFKVSDGPWNLKYAGIRPGGEPKFINGLFKQFVWSVIYFTVCSYLSGAHLGIAVNFWTGKAFLLDSSGGINTLLDWRWVFMGYFFRSSL